MTLINVLGQGAYQARRMIKNGEVRFIGTPADHTRSLGAIVNTRCTYGDELRARKIAVRNSYYEIRGFWGAKGVPFRWKRAMFIGRIINAALANVESFLPTAKEYKQLTLLVLV